MLRTLTLPIALLLAIAVIPAPESFGQSGLIAFPGAGGAGRFATGGRGGDVYFVTKLEDTLTSGTFRWGIETATGPRTILFDVTGTIHLQNALKIKKSQITIAGQSAPGGGITFADQQFGVSECNNVIIQYVRARLGDDPASRASEPAPDAFNVGTVNDVMIDHVTASWSIDETLPVTHESSNVTVQYSIISEALKMATHPDGNHSFAVGIDHGDISFHHNLLANNDSRNPRVGDLARVDVVNNVISNPGSRYGYSSGSADTPSINLVNNFGIDGADTSSSTSLYRSESSANPSIFFQGNLRDTNRNGILEETVPTTSQLRNGTITTLSQRVDLPQVTTTNARGAYIQVLSHAGATTYRDAADRRVVRDVMNQNGDIINSPSQVGGYPVLPTGTKPSDANRDGVADWFAAQHGYSVLSTAPKINNVLLPSGYTMLESYLHAITPNAYLPAKMQPLTVSTAFGRGADAYITENGGASATSGGNGTGTSLNAIWSGSSGVNNQAIILKFDLAQIAPGTITDASLQLTTSSSISGSHTFHVFGVEHDATDWDWNEDSVTFENAPGVNFNANSGSLGIAPPGNDIFGNPTNRNVADILTLGTMTLNTTAAGQTVTFNNANLAVFLNQAAFFQNTEQRGVVSIILEQTNSASMASFYSQEGNVSFAPRLTLQAVAAPILMGDVNADGVVDSLDIDLVMDHWGESGPIGDANGDSIVNIFDAAVISENWTYPEPAIQGVPEPASLLMLCLCVACCMGLRRPRTAMNSLRFVSDR